MDTLQATSYQFKICVTLREYPQAIAYLEKVMSYIVDYSSEEVEILNRLANELLAKGSKVLNAISTVYRGALSELKYHNRVVLDNYSKYVHCDSVELVKRLLLCVERIGGQVLEVNSRALCWKIIGKLNAFLSVHGNGDKSAHLESALIHYKRSIALSIEQLPQFDLLRLRILLAYCKFIGKYMKDNYRSLLFCMNVIEEIHTSLDQNGLDDEKSAKETQVLLEKFKQFYEDNAIDYNQIVLKYFP